MGFADRPQANVNPKETRAGRLDAQPDWDDASQGDAADEVAFKALTREEAQALRARIPPLSPWRVVAAQAAAGVFCAALWWLFTQEGGKAWSALYGVIAVVVPNALMAWGTSRRPVGHAGAALLSLMFWELIKIVLVIAILVAVAMRASDLSWPALLLTMIVSLKVNWLALLMQGRIKKISDGN
ncbi:ATP synthase subunit I [Kinneretia asaccharophila]|uniref:ATP synthase protein I n=1 Tax=Roseateles asaccharophilus TaxID=582607 RepID=A0A4R6NC88_9BURK|nr:ATP synthase subunit I [Roseateles asaccharophilus]MDN3545009.1 ATP synthase subunit I [Roseateles asaccharophilus]TDP12605.1 ATP synthase protein I [Roseateles asaccharophilus]